MPEAGHFACFDVGFDVFTSQSKAGANWCPGIFRKDRPGKQVSVDRALEAVEIGDPAGWQRTKVSSAGECVSFVFCKIGIESGLKDLGAERPAGGAAIARGFNFFGEGFVHVFNFGGQLSAVSYRLLN